MSKVLFEPSGALLEADVLADVSALADPPSALPSDDEDHQVPLEAGCLCDFSLSADGTRLLTAVSTDYGVEFESHLSVWVREGSTWRVLWTVPTPSFALHAVAFLPDSKRVLIAEANLGRDLERQEIGKYSSLLTVRDVRKGRLVGEQVVDDLDDLQQFALGGVKPVAVLGYPRKLCVCDPTDFKGEPRVIETEGDNLRGMAVHPTGRFLLTVADGPSVSVWDTATWTVQREHDWKIGKLRSVTVSADGSVAAVGSARGVVTLWDWEL
jgi:WD40 repeat protein